MVIDLKTFIEGYKKSEVIHGDLRWKFREPRLKDLDKPVMEILEIGCIEWEWSAFETFLEEELPASKQAEFLEEILKELGLA